MRQKTVSVFPVPLIGVQLLDKVLTSPILMIKNSQNWESTRLASRIHLYEPTTKNADLFPEIHFSETGLRSESYEGESYSKTRLITVVYRHHVKNLQIERSNSAGSSV